MMPVFTIFPPGKKSPLRHSVVPQSPQKCDVIVPPESPVLVNSLGVPRDVSVEIRGGKGAGLGTGDESEVLVEH